MRRLPGTPWLTGNRYNKDPDGNGLAMEGEAGFGAYYDQTEVIVFDRRTPAAAWSSPPGAAAPTAPARPSTCNAILRPSNRANFFGPLALRTLTLFERDALAFAQLLERHAFEPGHVKKDVLT